MGAARARVVVFDAGALIGLERADERVRALLSLALKRRATIVVPTGVLAQVWRDGARQARLSRFLLDSAVTLDALDPATARACGVLCGRAGTADVVDASVVVAALRRKAVIVTSDLADLRRLDARVAIEAL